MRTLFSFKSDEMVIPYGELERSKNKDLVAYFNGPSLRCCYMGLKLSPCPELYTFDMPHKVRSSYPRQPVCDFL